MGFFKKKSSDNGGSTDSGKGKGSDPVDKLLNQSRDQDQQDYENHNDPMNKANNDANATSDRVAAQRQANRRWGKDKQPHGDED